MDFFFSVEKVTVRTVLDRVRADFRVYVSGPGFPAGASD